MCWVEGAPEETHFEVKAEPISLSVELGSNDIVVKNLYVSIDPYQLNRMKGYSSSQKTTGFAVAISPGEVSHMINIYSFSEERTVNLEILFDITLNRKLMLMVWEELWLQETVGLTRMTWW